MAMSEKEKKQAIVLGVLVVVLVVIVFVDPFGFGLFGGDSQSPQPQAPSAGATVISTESEQPATAAPAPTPKPAAFTSPRGADGLPVVLPLPALAANTRDPMVAPFWPPEIVGPEPTSNRQYFSFDQWSVDPQRRPRVSIPTAGSSDSVWHYEGDIIVDLVEKKQWRILKLDDRRTRVQAKQMEFPFQQYWFNGQGFIVPE